MRPKDFAILFAVLALLALAGSIDHESPSSATAHHPSTARSR